MPIGNLFGGGATKAANIQANAATQAAQIQANSAQQGLDFQKQVYGQTQQQLAPWLSTGTNAINRLNQLMGLPANSPQAAPQLGGSTNTNFPNQIPNVGGFDGSTRLRDLMGTDMSGATGNGPLIDGATGQFVPDAGTFGGTTATGTGAMTSSPLSSLSGNDPSVQPFQDWTQQFVAPTAATEQNDPGYQFRLQEGQKALENSAAARGGLLTGGTAKALTQYGQDYASNEYQNVYNRALGQYQQGYNIFENNQANQFNRLSALSGGGQTTAGQLGQFGQQAASNVGNLLMQQGNAQASGVNNAAAARASGYTANQNATNSGMSQMAQIAMMAAMFA